MKFAEATKPHRKSRFGLHQLRDRCSRRGPTLAEFLSNAVTENELVLCLLTFGRDRGRNARCADIGDDKYGGFVA